MTFVDFQIFLLGTSYTCDVKLLYIALVTQHVCTNIHNHLLITWSWPFLDWHHDIIGQGAGKPKPIQQTVHSLHFVDLHLDIYFVGPGGKEA